MLKGTQMLDHSIRDIASKDTDGKARIVGSSRILAPLALYLIYQKGVVLKQFPFSINDLANQSISLKDLRSNPRHQLK